MRDNISRRTLATGLAWTVPGVALAVAAPQVAASVPCPSCLTSGSTTSSLTLNGGAWAFSGLNFNFNISANAACLTQFPSLAVSLNTGVVTFGVPSGSTATQANPNPANWTATFNTGVSAGTYKPVSGGYTLGVVASGLVPGTEPPAPPNGTYNYAAGTQPLIGVQSICVSGTMQYTSGGTVTRNITLCKTLTHGTRNFSRSTNIVTGLATDTISYSDTLSAGLSSVTCS